jgi:hypothetical protein
MLFKILLIATCVLVPTLATSCLDPNGKEVPWFAILHMPGSTYKKNNVTYAYIDDNSLKVPLARFTLYNTYIEDLPTSPFAKTLD